MEHSDRGRVCSAGGFAGTYRPRRISASMAVRSAENDASRAACPSPTVENVNVRFASFEDFGDVGALLVRAYEVAWGPTGWNEYREELLDVAGRSGQCETLVAELDGVVVGAVTVVPPDSPMRQVDDAGALELRMLGVEPAVQRHGVARTLLAACAERAIAMNLWSLVLQSDEDLEAAHALYDQLGFRRRPEVDVPVGDGYRALGFELNL